MRKMFLYGCSAAGLRIAEELQNSGHTVTILMSPGSPFTGRLEHKKMQVLTTALDDPELLSSCGLDEADCLLLTSEDEKFNIRTALSAHDLYPGLRIVIRLYNTALGRKLENIIRNLTVLSISNIAAPFFNASALTRQVLGAVQAPSGTAVVRNLNINGLEKITVENLEKRYSIRVIHASAQFFPPAGEVIDGQDLTVLGDLKTLEKITPESEQTSPLGGQTEATLTKKHHPDPMLLTLTAVLLAIVIAAVVYFYFSENLSLVNSLYFVVTVITTTGFGDISLKDSSLFSKLAGVFLMLSGVALSAMLFSLITDSLLKKRVELFFGRGRQRQKNHVVLCGMGDVGMSILHSLQKTGTSVVVVERNPDGRFVQDVRALNVPLVIADAVRENTLINAGIRNARALICAADDDITNLEIALNAAALNPGIRIVARIYEEHFAVKVKKHFGINAAVSSSAVAAPVFAAAAMGRVVNARLLCAGRQLELFEVPLSDRNALDKAITDRNCRLVYLSGEKQLQYTRLPDDKCEAYDRAGFIRIVE